MRDLLQEPLDWLKIHGWVARETTPPSWSHGPITLICSEQGTWGDFTHRTDEPRHGWHNSPLDAFHVSYRKLLEEKAYYERARVGMAATLIASVQTERQGR
jgi:hypothetical protein